MSALEQWAALGVLFSAAVLVLELVAYPEQRRRARRELCKLGRRACRLTGRSGRS